MNKLFFIVAAVISLSCCSSLGSENAKDLNLRVLRGGYVNLENLKGHYTLLHFWASWCKMCKQELITLQNLERAAARRDFRIVTVAIDSPEQGVIELTENYNLKLPILLDLSDKAKNHYKVSEVPMTMLLNESGEIIKFIEPDSGNLVTRTKGPQSWDRPDVIKYFKNLK
jgi:peroxiredoxin